MGLDKVLSLLLLFIALGLGLFFSLTYPQVLFSTHQQVSVIVIGFFDIVIRILIVAALLRYLFFL